MLSKAERIGSALETLNVEEQTRVKDVVMRTVGFYSKNHHNYFLADIAVGMYGYTSVPIYDTHGEEGTKHIFKETRMQVCFIETCLVQKLLSYKKKNPEFGTLETLVVLDEENYSDEREEIDGVKIYTFSQFEKIG